MVVEFLDLTALDRATIYIPLSTTTPLELFQNLGKYLRRDIHVSEHIHYVPVEEV